MMTLSRGRAADRKTTSHPRSSSRTCVNRTHSRAAIVAIAAVSMIAGASVSPSQRVHAQSAVPPPGVAAGAPPLAVPGPVDVTGVWIDHTGRGAVEIVPCGLRVCGYLYWIKDTITKQGQPLIDSRNPDRTRRNKPLCGTQILLNLAQEKAVRIGHIWGGGSIYNPEDGELFDAEIKLNSANELTVLGYAGMKFLGETFAWKRAPADLQRCGPPRV